MPTEVTTLCFHTRDAASRDDSTLTFEMPSHRLRTAAALGIRPKKWCDGCREGIRSTLDDRSPLTDEFAMDR